MKRICIWLIRFYQKYISPRKSKPTCRFYPSCSAFALEAFEKRGFFAGSALTFFRILRCNPFCPGGYDPVPEKGITIRSYWATHGRGQFLTDDDQQNTDEPDQTPEASSLSDAPTAGGNPSDHRETAAETDDTPKAACARYRQGEKTL